MAYRNSNPRRSSGDFGGNRVYVGDIGSRMNRSDLEREFGQYGPVTDVWMGNKREPTAPDYAFVVFRYPEDADEAVRDRNGRKLLGRTVRVEHARPMNNRRGGGGGGGGRGGGWGGGNRDYGSQRGGGGASYRRRSNSRERGSSRRSRSQSPVRGSRSQQSPPPNRQRVDNYSRKPAKRSPSDSPDAKKYNKSKRQSSASVSPPPLARPNQRAQDSDSASPSPPPKKQKQRPRSESESPPPEDEYDARQYQRGQGDQGNARKGKPVMTKGNYGDDSESD